MGGAFIGGFLTSAGLIMAIGAQNAFVLRQGLRREHVLPVVLICAASDAVLIALGVAGFSALDRAVPWAGQAMLWAGAGFLLVYGALRFRAAARGGEALVPAAGAPAPLGRVLATCLILTWANPHVWLDTVALLGAVAAQYGAQARIFGLGAALASFAFFGALGFGARWLSPVFARPRAWVWLELAMGVVMWSLAAGLLLRA